MNTDMARTTAAIATNGQRQEVVLERYLVYLARDHQRRDQLERANVEQERKQKHAVYVQLFMASLPRIPPPS